jgi:hypothetical protein
VLLAWPNDNISKCPLKSGEVLILSVAERIAHRFLMGGRYGNTGCRNCGVSGETIPLVFVDTERPTPLGEVVWAVRTLMEHGVDLQ